MIPFWGISMLPIVLYLPCSRNADSGKVMGLKGRRVHLIEEITETIISFQRVVPGAKERLVQITGRSWS